MSPKAESTIATKKAGISGLICTTLVNFLAITINSHFSTQYENPHLCKIAWTGLLFLTRSLQLCMHVLQTFEMSKSHNGQSAFFHCVDDLQPQMQPRYCWKSSANQIEEFELVY